MKWSISVRILQIKQDLILRDCWMPLMKEIDAMIEILKIDKNTKIIFVSADVTVKKQMVSKGTTAFLNKPFDIQDLLNLIKKILNE